ncbi:tetratricopeptide repeat protein [Gloeobacter violaceus]|nr:hypothetical protein [Gloeobacter violaceus]
MKLLPWLSAVGLLLGWSAAAEATPFTPKSDGEVLERVRVRPADPQARALRELRTRLARQPQDLALALQLARRYIERGRIEADPRYNGYAQAALAPWWEQPKPPAPVLVMRATLRQADHDFEGALADLKLALAANPRDPQAWVTRALVQQVRGEYAEARKSCVPVMQFSSQLAGITCLSGVASLNGQAATSYALLERVITARTDASAGEKLWAQTLLAEIAHRRGDPQKAEKHFRTAMAVGPDSYLLGAYADFLLDEKRPREAVELLKGRARADGLLLRLAIAEQRLGLAQSAVHRTELAARFAASRRRGDEAVHRREEARFTLELLQQPRTALKLALANWQTQREPADARILLAAAQASGDAAAARPAIDWLKQSRLEDRRVNALMQELGAKA